MIAGRLKYKLELYKPTATSNAYGEETVTWVKTATVHAERVKITGRRSEEVQEHFPEYATEFNIRDAHEVGNNWRVQQLGGYLYTVTNIIPNIDKGYLTLVCQRVND